MGAYSEKAPGAIYWNSTDKKGVSPLELVRRANAKHGDLFQPALLRVKRLDKSVLDSIIKMVPDDWMSPLARQFALELMCYNMEELGKIVK